MLREVHPLPKVDETLAQLSGAKLFSKLDANSGFWQIPLSQNSQHLTTFITPFGRYCFNKLPFGISSAPEHFQKRMSAILTGLDGVVCQMDDVLVHGRDATEHDARLMRALEQIKKAGATLNKDKCQFGKERIEFLGHVIDANGISADPNKLSALVEMKKPENITELRRFMGMANQLGKFSHRLAEISKPLRVLLSTNNEWSWGADQDHAFCAMKEELAKPPTLGFYNPEAKTKIVSDASSYGLGAVILQENKEDWKPVAFASRSLTETEQHYATIEKEALGITWACEKFATYVLGMRFQIETDHKPLIPLLSCKHLDNFPPRILRFRLRLNRFDYSIHHVPGKLMSTADALSRSPVAPPGDASIKFQEELESYLQSVTTHLPASNNTLERYKKAQSEDSVCSAIQKYCKLGWPSKYDVSPELRPYWVERSKFTLSESLLLYGSRIVVPAKLQKETLGKLHQGHQGVQRCHLRATNSVWWPGVSKEIKEMIRNCLECAKHSSPHAEPMIASSLPEYPWQKIASDLFYLDGITYLLVVDYFSRYPEIVQMKSTTSASVVSALRSIFSRHGVPEVLMTDNGPQYDCREMKEFATAYGFSHITSSPHFPQSNGLAERTVKTVKQLLKKSEDPFLALLSYRATPFPWCGLSPAELLMGRKIRSGLPQVIHTLAPKWPYLLRFRQCNQKFKRQQERNYNKRHRARPLSPIDDDSPVWVQTDNRRALGKVVSPAATPRSYMIDTPTGEIRRNRQHLIPVPGEGLPDTAEERPPGRSPIMTRARSGIQVAAPKRLYH